MRNGPNRSVVPKMESGDRLALCIAPRGADDEQVAAALKDFAPVSGSPAWVWRVAKGAMPPPPRQSRSMAVAERVS